MWYLTILSALFASALGFGEEAARDQGQPRELRTPGQKDGSFIVLTTSKRAPRPREPGLKVGDKAPAIDGLLPDGNALLGEHLAGKTILLTFWSADDATTRQHFNALRRVRRKLAGRDRFQIVSVRRGGEFEDWLKFLDKQPPLDKRFPRQPFYSDPTWWQVFHHPPTRAPQNPFGVGRDPASFAISPDGVLLAVQVADADLLKTVQTTLDRTRVR